MNETIQVRDSRPKGFFWADNELIDDLAKQIGVYALAVYMALCRYSDNRNSTAAVSLRQLERRLGISRPSITKAIDTLIAHRLITSERRSSSQGNDRNVYTLCDLKALVNVVDHPGKPALPPMVNVVDHPGKPALPVIKTTLQDSDQNDVSGALSVLKSIHQAIPEKLRPIAPESDLQTARAILSEGHTAQDCARFVSELYAGNAWVQDKVIGVKYVSKRIRAWKNGSSSTASNIRPGTASGAPVGVTGAAIPNIKKFKPAVPNLQRTRNADSESPTK